MFTKVRFIVFFFLASITLFTILGLGLKKSDLPESKPNTYNQSAFIDLINELIKDPDLERANWGVSVVDVDNGETLFEYNSGRSLMPASTFKLAISGAALGILGPETSFLTKLGHTGKVSEGGMLTGNIWIKGAGDPSLGSDRFGEQYSLEKQLEKWVKAIQGLGITQVKGSVIGDGSVFEDQMTPDNWQWNDMGNYYGAGASGLTIHENMYHLYFSSGKKVGDPTKVLQLNPIVPDIKFINEVTSGAYGTGDNAYIFGTEYNYLRYLRGTIPPNRSEFMIKGSVPDPPLLAAQLLEMKLEEAGIEVSGAAETIRLKSRESGFQAPEELNYFHMDTSATVAEIVYWFNKKSVNLMGEHLLKICGWKSSGKGTAEAGVEAIKTYWTEKGVDVKGLNIEDGCGLSRNNGITTEQMTQILSLMKSEPHYDDFFRSLSIAGDWQDKDGTLNSLVAGTSAAKKVWAKSGFISGVRGYAGYAEMKSGKTAAFSMISNNYTCSNSEMRRKFEKLIVGIVEE